MAYADSLTGPWTMFDGKVLSLENSTMATESGQLSNLSTLRQYTSFSETYVLIQVGNANKKSNEIREKENGKVSAITTPHIASPEVIMHLLCQAFYIILKMV